MPSFKPVGVDADSLFPTRVMNALKQLFLQSSNASAVATSGKYSDLEGTPAIPSSAAAVHAEPEGLSTDTKASLKATYLPLALQDDSITYNGDGTIATTVAGGVTTTYTWNPDGTVASETKLGKTKTWSYDGNGNPTGSAVA